MDRCNRAATALLAAAIGLAGCGGAGSSAIGGRSPHDVVLAAARAATQSSLRLDATMRLGFDTGSLHDGALGALPASGFAMTAAGEQESEQRVRMTMTLEPLVDHPVTVVLYDGVGYVALDGQHFAEVGSLRNLFGGLELTPTQLQQILGKVATISDVGAGEEDGQSVERYHATLDGSILDQLFGRAGTAGPLATVLRQVFTFRGGSVDFSVLRDSGRLDRVLFHVRFAIDAFAIGQLVAPGPASSSGDRAPSGSLGVRLDGSLHYHDYGAHIVVSRPMVDPNAPTLPATGFFGTAA